MNWSEIIISVVSVVLSSLMTWMTSKIAAWLNTKIKNEKISKMVYEIKDILCKSAKATYQTYVENIKGTEFWTEDAQKKALRLATDKAKSQLSEEAKKYIIDNFGNLDEYLAENTEAELYDLKN